MPVYFPYENKGNAHLTKQKVACLIAQREGCLSSGLWHRGEAIQQKFGLFPKPTAISFSQYIATGCLLWIM